MVVHFESQPAVRFGAPRVAVDMTRKEANGLTAAFGYDLSRDSQRFLLSRPQQVAEDEAGKRIIVQNWLSAVRK